MFDRIQADVKSEIEKGVQFALAAPFPELGARSTRTSTLNV